MTITVRPAPGAGFVMRAGDLLAVCADAGADTVIALVRRVAAAGGDGADLVAALPADAPDCALAGPVPGGMAVAVRGAAVAEVDGRPVTGGVHGPVRTVLLRLSGAGTPDPRTSLDGGVIAAAGLVAEITARQPVVRAPDRGAPFEAVILLPGYADRPAPPAVDPEADTQALVEGVVCRNDHFNDPLLRYCQICGISMAQLTKVTRLGRRPSLGVLLLDDGSTLRLDRDYVAGREPDQHADVVAGRARPLRLAGPVSGVSRRHLRVGLAGWQVEVVDLGSANGTHVRLPGTGDTTRLVPDEPFVLRPGSRVELGRRWFQYESHRNP